MCMFLGLTVLLGGIIFLGRDFVLAHNNTRGEDMFENELLEVMSQAESIDLIINGDRRSLQVKEAIKTVDEMMEGYHEMPAFGVSLDAETRHAMQDGAWMELKYRHKMTHNGMPFETLLIEVKPEYGGFNVIRQLDGKYEGRCFYVSLNGDMSELYNYLAQKIDL